MKPEAPRLWGEVDPQFVAGPFQESCRFGPCTLHPEHEGPHLDAHHISGRIFGLWPNNGTVIGPEDISDEAVKIVQEINRLRNEAMEAILEAGRFKEEMLLKYEGSTDEHVNALFNVDIWPNDELSIAHSGTEAGDEAGIREEIIDILGLGQEEW